MHPSTSLAQVKTAVLSAAGSGDNTVVAAVSGKKLRVVAVEGVSSGTVTLTWKSSTTTALTGAMPLVAQTGLPFSAPMMEGGWFETAAGELLNANLSGAVGIYGIVKYQEIG